MRKREEADEWAEEAELTLREPIRELTHNLNCNELIAWTAMKSNIGLQIAL